VDKETSGPDDLDGLRAERDDWRRRAEVAEAVAAERLARADTAERALAAAEAALANLGHATAVTPAAASTASADTTAPADEPAPPRPRSLLERWRRYTDTIN
jgi:hypothetical protein